MEEINEDKMEEKELVEKTKTHERFKQFWQEMAGIIELLNETNDKFHSTSINSPAVTLYLQWRTLNELKKVQTAEAKLNKKLEELNEQMKRMGGVLSTEVI